MSNHTPGPWEASDEVILCADTNMAIGSVFPFDRDKTGFTYGDVTKSNARLVAAAPELLEALQKMVRWYARREAASTLLPAEYQDYEVKQAMRAIAKATGEQP